MSLINQALKKAQHRNSEPNRSAVAMCTPDAQGTSYGSEHTTRTRRNRWYLIAFLLVPCMTLPIITSRWNHEKKHYQEEIEILKNTPTAPVAKYDFRPKETALATLNDSKTTELTLQKTELAQLPPPKESGSRHLAKRAENPAISTFLNESRISSIRAAGKNSKIVINSRTVPIDGYVNDQLRVRVSKINSNEIVFVDDNGYEYRKQF